MEVIDGTVTKTATYSPYGKLIAQIGWSGTAYGYAGEQYDQMTQLVYLRARYYNPALKLFVSVDPFAGYYTISASQHPYTYVHNNPTNLTDPSGLCAEVGEEMCWALAEQAWRAGLGTLDRLGSLTEQELRDLLIGMSTVISREEWGALDPTVGILFEDEPNMFHLQYMAGYSEGFYDVINNVDGYACYDQLRPNEPLADILDTIVIHHEGDRQTYDVRRVQLQHMIENGWTDIGYHFAIGLDGMIFEGRDIAVRGSHVSGANTGSIGILFLGDFNPGLERGNWPDRDDYPSPQLIVSAIELIRWLDFRYGIDQVVGHQDVPRNFTACPGENCLFLIPLFNAIVQEQ